MAINFTLREIEFNTMPRYKIDTDGSKYQWDHSSGEWVLIEGNPVGEAVDPDATTPDETDEE